MAQMRYIVVESCGECEGYVVNPTPIDENAEEYYEVDFDWCDWADKCLEGHDTKSGFPEWCPLPILDNKDV